MSTTQLLREQRASIWEQMKEVYDLAASENRDLTVEEQTKYDTAEKDLDKVDVQVAEAEAKEQRTQRHGEREKEMATVDRTGVIPGQRDPDDSETAYREAFRDYLRYGVTDLEPEQRKLLQRGFVNDPDIRMAQGVGTGSAGGYTVPAGFRDELIRTAKDFGSVLQVAQVLTTDSGENLVWPTVDDTSNVGVILAENTQLTEQDAALGQASLDAYLITSKLTRVSLQLIQDTAIDPEGLVVSLHGERIGRGMNVYLTTGTGTAQPDGIVTNAATGVTAASATAITGDELIDLQESIDPAYRNERSRFMLAQATLAKVRKLKDGQNNYLWQPSAQAGAPNTLFGEQYVINQQMPAATTGNKSVLFGDFHAGYVVRIVRSVQNVRFAERYMDYFQVGFTSFARFDGTQQNAAAYKALVQA